MKSRRVDSAPRAAMAGYVPVWIGNENQSRWGYRKHQAITI